MENLYTTLFVLGIILFQGMEQGFRLKRDMTNKSIKKKALYDTLFHIFVWFPWVIWGGLLWYSDEYKLDYSYPSLIQVGVCMAMLRFGLYSLTINICNLDNRPINYVRENHWTFDIWEKIFKKQYPVQTLWYFRGLA